MSEHEPKKLPISISGLTESQTIRIAQELSAQLGCSMTFEAGSIVSFNVYMPGACMKEQNASATTASVGNITDSTVGSIGNADDVTIFINRIECSALADDVKVALKDARLKLAELELSAGLKKDVAEYLDKVTAVLQEPTPDRSRLKSLLTAIKAAAPTIAAVLSMAASLTKLLTP